MRICKSTNIHYKMIYKYYSYGKTVSLAHNIPLINRIDEGLLILEEIGASLAAMEAFCIVPLLHCDEELACFIKNDNIERFNPVALILAMEFKAVDNSYTLNDYVNKNDTIETSYLKEVNNMLIAYNVQRRKDFLVYHLHTHDNRVELHGYYHNWLVALDVDDLEYARLAKKIMIGTVEKALLDDDYNILKAMYILGSAVGFAVREVDGWQKLVDLELLEEYDRGDLHSEETIIVMKLTGLGNAFVTARLEEEKNQDNTMD